MNNLEITAAEAVVQQQLDAYNAHDIDAFLDTYQDDAQLFSFPATALMAGKDAIRKCYEPLFGDAILRNVIAKRIVMGNTVIDHERIQATLPDGPGVMEAVVIYEVAEGKIAKVTLIYGTITPGGKLD